MEKNNKVLKPKLKKRKGENHIKAKFSMNQKKN